MRSKTPEVEGSWEYIPVVRVISVLAPANRFYGPQRCAETDSSLTSACLYLFFPRIRGDEIPSF